MVKAVKKSVLLIVLALSLGGCAVIDFLDGKYADPSPRGNNYPSSNGGSGGHGRPTGGSHSH